MTVLSPPWPPPVESFVRRAKSNAKIFTSPINGASQAAAAVGNRYEFDVRTYALDDRRMGAWGAFLDDVTDKMVTFYWNTYPKARPLAYPQGLDATITCDRTDITCDITTITCDNASPWGSPTVTTDGQTGRSLGITGLTANALFYSGDYFAFENGSYREMHRITADVTADGSGNATFTFTPPIRISPSASTEILLDGHTPAPNKRMACEVVAVDGGQAAEEISGFQIRTNPRFVELPR